MKQIIIAFISTCFIIHSQYAQLRVPPVTFQAPHQAPLLPELTFNPRAYDRVCPEQKPSFPLTHALIMENPSIVAEYYSNWYGHFFSGEYQRSVAGTLEQAAQLPREKGQKVVSFLLTKLDPMYIGKKIDCLLERAIQHGYLDLIQYIGRHYPEQINWALLDAIMADDATSISNLMTAGVNPEAGIGKEEKEQYIIHVQENKPVTYTHEPNAHYPLHFAAQQGKPQAIAALLRFHANPLRLNHLKQTPVHTAAKSFLTTDTAEKIEERLLILRYLLEKMPEITRPIAQELLPSHIFDENIRKKIRTTVAAFEIAQPRKISMTEDEIQQEIAQFIEKKRSALIGISAICSCFVITVYEKCCNKPTTVEPIPKKAELKNLPKKKKK